MQAISESMVSMVLQLRLVSVAVRRMVCLFTSQLMPVPNCTAWQRRHMSFV